MLSRQKPKAIKNPAISPASNTSHSNAGRPARNATHNVAGGPLKAALLGITLVLAAFIIPKAISPHWPPSLFLSDAGFNDIVIHARGTNGQEKVALYINDAPVQFWNLTTSFQDYTYTPPTAITVNNLSIHFLNDRWEPESGINYDVQVDYITVNGTRYDSEHNSTISTGSWDQNDWCAPGNKSQEWLHCSGSFTYNIPAGTVVGIGAPITLTPPTLTGTLDSQSQITLTWNTVPEATSYRINRGGTFYQEITGTTLIETGLTPDTEYVYSVRAKKDENISSGSNVVRLKTVGTSSGLNVVSHEAIDITETTAKLRFTASENVQAYTDYGTDINYGLQTNQETSFDYATHVQTLSDLTPGTQYFYKIVVINQASEQVTDTGTFTTTGGVSAPVCGNNQVEAGEQCDDGNTVGGDGCSSTCNTETSSNLTIDAHVATDITQTSVRLRFTASENVQAYTEYGTTTSYGSQTATETSFNYATHAQSITGLTEDTTYYYRINVTNQVGENSTATGTFTTSSGTVTPPPPTGSSMTFSQINQGKPSYAKLSHPDEYLAEYLRQNPSVCFWDLGANTVTPVADPAPDNSTVITLPAPNGSDDTAVVRNAIAQANGGTVRGNGSEYRIKSLTITNPVTIKNMPMRPASGTSRMITVNSADVRVFDSPMDIKKQDGVGSGYFLSEGAHRFTLVRSDVKNILDTSPTTVYAVWATEADDIHIACNNFTHILSNSTDLERGSAKALWMNPGTTGSKIARGGVFANNVISEMQANRVGNAGAKGSNGVVIQSYGPNEISDRPFRIMANRAVDMGRRFVKMQDGNVKVLSNTAHWDTTQGPLGVRSLQSFAGAHYSSDIDVKNNHFIYSSARTPQDMIAVIQNANVPRNNHFDNNRLEYRNNPSYAQTSYVFAIRIAGGGTAGEQTTSSFKNNVIDGPGKPKYFFDLRGYANPSRFPLGSNTYNTTWESSEYR